MGGDDFDAPYAPATHEEMRAARLPISFRDGCAGLLIPLNKCRQANMYMPFRCGHERHEYEKWCVSESAPTPPIKWRPLLSSLSPS
jgi:hypothetical protein